MLCSNESLTFRTRPRAESTSRVHHKAQVITCRTHSKSRSSKTPGAVHLQQRRRDVSTRASSGFLLDMSEMIETGATVKIVTEKECSLGVSLYPDFAYNAEGGGGLGKVTAMDIDGKVAVTFDPMNVNVPTISSATSDLMGMPLPPMFKAEINVKSLTGFLERRSGKVDLQMDAEIIPGVPAVLDATPMKLFMNLTTETTWGATRSARGKRIDSEGRCQLVGVARIPPNTDPVIGALLMLPTDALAVLQVRFEFMPTKM